MPRRERMRYRFKETPEPLKPLTTAVIQLIAGALLLVALVLFIEHATHPRVLMFDFLFR